MATIAPIAASRALGMSRALDARPQLRIDGVASTAMFVLDAQRDGLIDPRTRIFRFAYITSGLAAVEYASRLLFCAAPGSMVRLLRVQFYVRNNIVVPPEREVALRTLSRGEIRIFGTPLDPTGSQGFNIPDLFSPPTPESGFIGSTVDPDRDADVLAEVTAAAARLTYDAPGSGIVLDSRFGPSDLRSVLVGHTLELYWRRTPLLNDEDAAVVHLTYHAAPVDCYPHQ